MPQITAAEFHALPLRVNTLLADVPLHDVWAVDLPRLSGDVTLDAFLARSGQSIFGSPDSKMERLPLAARALFSLRVLLGRMFGLEAQPMDAGTICYADRLNAEDRARSSIAAGTADGLFLVVYRFDNEQLLELHNRTVHAAALSALTETANGYRCYFAVYVAAVGWITPVYMALIDPFRRWIIYPALMNSIRQNWLRAMSK